MESVSSGKSVRVKVMVFEKEVCFSSRDTFTVLILFKHCLESCILINYTLPKAWRKPLQ